MQTAEPLREHRAGRTLSMILGKIGFWAALAAFLALVLLPIYYIFLAAFVPGTKVFTRPLTYIPQSLGIDRFQTIFEQIPIGRYLLNTFLLSTVSAVVSLIVCFLAAYAIARISFPGANLVLIILLLTSMLPGVATVIPLFKLYQRVHLMDTFQGLVILYVSAVLPFTTWVFVSFIRQVPLEIEEAARVDGAGFFRLLREIVVPLVTPAIATLFLINFIASWNEFFTPLIFARGSKSKVITVALSEAGSLGADSQFFSNWSNISAVAILATLPVFVLTLMFQRQITDGITSGAVK